MIARSLRHRATALAALLSLTACAARRGPSPGAGQEPPFEPRAFRSQLALPATRVMVLGVSHFDAAPKAFAPAWLAPVLCRLRGYAPDVILTEAMPGEQVMGLAAYAPVHGTAGEYAGPTLAWARGAQAALGLTAAEALRQATDSAPAPGRPATAVRLLAPTPAQRRRLAALFLAAAEPYSALVQWMQLGGGDRVAGDGLTAEMIAQLGRIDGKRSELSSLAARLAADLGHARVYGAGDHASDYVQGDWGAFQRAAAADPALMAQLRHETPELVPINGASLALSSPDRVLPALRVLNSARFGRLDAGAQYGAILRSPALGGQGRRIVDAWEAQNLHMATAVREVTALVPGGRALLIVGAAHKAYIEAYLGALSDIEIASSAELLDAPAPGCDAGATARPPATP